MTILLVQLVSLGLVPEEEFVLPPPLLHAASMAARAIAETAAMMAFFFTVCIPFDLHGLRCLKVLLVRITHAASPLRDEVQRGALQELLVPRALRVGGQECFAGDSDGAAFAQRPISNSPRFTSTRLPSLR